MQLSFFNQIPENDLLHELFQAYFDCRSNKRNTANALQFERNFESRIFELRDEILAGSYAPRRCIAFIVNKPVKREIFAADFRDRVVHHFLIRKLNPLFEELFIDNSFACRVNKGTLHGILKTADMMKQLTEGYKKDVYVMKLDIAGFFMNIDRHILFQRLQDFINERYFFSDRELVTALFHKVIFQDPAGNCIIRGKKSDWEGLPHNKSLFGSKSGCGLPIGNLTSQVLANFYLHSLDAFMLERLPEGYYGRYVDDFVLMHPSKHYLLELKKHLSDYLTDQLKLELHPRKMILQHYAKGFPFLGAVIKPHRLYSSRRTKGNFFNAVDEHLRNLRHDSPSPIVREKVVSSVNSYVGHLMHFNTFRLRSKMLVSFKSFESIGIQIRREFLYKSTFDSGLVSTCG